MVNSPTGWHDLELVAGSELGGGQGGESSAGKPLDADPKLAPRWRWSKSNSFAGRRLRPESALHGHVLAGQIGELRGESVGHVEGDRDRLVGEVFHCGHSQTTELPGSSLVNAAP